MCERECVYGEQWAHRKGKQLDLLAAPLYDLSLTIHTPSVQFQGAPVMYSGVNGTLRS